MEIDIENARMWPQMPVAQALTIWIEKNRAVWCSRGVTLLEFQGCPLIAVPNLNHRIGDERWVFVGSLEAVDKRPLVEDEFVKVLISRDMGFEHACILIHNAVEQVAGR